MRVQQPSRLPTPLPLYVHRLQTFNQIAQCYQVLMQSTDNRCRSTAAHLLDLFAAVGAHALESRAPKQFAGHKPEPLQGTDKDNTRSDGLKRCRACVAAAAGVCVI